MSNSVKINRCTYQINWLNCNNINKWEDTCYTSDEILEVYDGDVNILQCESSGTYRVLTENAQSTSSYYSLTNLQEKVYDINIFHPTTWQNFFVSYGSYVNKVLKFPLTINFDSLRYLFRNLPNVTYINTKNVVTDNVTTILGIFSGDTSLETLDLSHWNTKNLTEINDAFYNCTSLKEIKGTNLWNLESLEQAYGAFQNCNELIEITLNFNNSPINNIACLFKNCTKLSRINGVEDWDTSKVTSFNNTFLGTNLDILNLSKWDTSSCTSVYGMFYTCKARQIDISNWDLSNVKTGYNNLTNSTSDSNANGWNYFFYSMPNLEEIYMNNVTLNSLFTSGYDVISNCPNLKRIYVCGCSDETKGYIRNRLNYANLNNVELIDKFKTNIWEWSENTKQIEVESGTATIRYKRYKWNDCDGNFLGWFDEENEYEILSIDYREDKCHTNTYLYNGDVKLDFNLQWQPLTTSLNKPTSTTYIYSDIFESFSNSYGSTNTRAKMRIYFKNKPNLHIYYYSDGYSTYNYLMLGNMDIELPDNVVYNTSGVKNHTRNSQKSWYGTTFPNDGGEHFIDVVYYKSSTNTNNGQDKGYICFAEPKKYTETLITTLSNAETTENKDGGVAYVIERDFIVPTTNTYDVTSGGTFNVKAFSYPDYDFVRWRNSYVNATYYNDNPATLPATGATTTYYAIFNKVLTQQAPAKEKENNCDTIIDFDYKNWTLNSDENNPNVSFSTSSTQLLKIKFSHLEKLKFKLFVGTTSTTNYVYFMVGKIDTTITTSSSYSGTYIHYTTRGKDLSTWYDVEIESPDNNEHFVYVVFTLTTASSTSIKNGMIQFDDFYISSRWSPSGGLICYNGNLYETLVKYISFNNFKTSIPTDSIKVGSIVERDSEVCQTNIDLNNQWQPSTVVIPLPDGISGIVYESFSNYHKGNNIAKMRIKFSKSPFKIWYRSDSEACCDYVVISKLDTTLPSSPTDSSTQVQYNTKDKANTWFEATYETAAGEHFIEIAYRKDGTVDTEPDKGFILLPSTPKDERWTLSENEYICDNGNKYQKYIKEVTYDGEIWVNSGEYRVGDLIEANTEECIWFNLEKTTPKGTPITAIRILQTTSGSDSYKWVHLGTTPTSTASDTNWCFAATNGGSSEIYIGNSRYLLSNVATLKDGYYEYDYGRTLYLLDIQSGVPVQNILYKTV